VAERAALEDVLLDPAVYDGRVILTHGRVTRDAADGAGKRLVVVRPSERDDRREAYCTYGPGTREALASESRVRLRAVVVATGTFRSPAGKPEAGMALVCSDVGG
jgi:hypothetical protein